MKDVSIMEKTNRRIYSRSSIVGGVFAEQTG